MVGKAQIQRGLAYLAEHESGLIMITSGPDREIDGDGNMNEVKGNLLEVKNIEKDFGGVKAIDKLSFQVRPKTIKGFIGPNGAGKTTAYNIISGVLTPTGGDIYFRGQKITGLKPCRIAELGLVRTFQNIQLFHNLTLLENVMMGRHTRSRSGFVASALRLSSMRSEEKNIKESALEIIEFMGLQDQLRFHVGNLPIGYQRLLEIARALAAEPELMLLDEPAAGLNTRETRQLAEKIYHIREKGVTMLVVEHDMELVMEISDEILVLEYGQKIAEDIPRNIQTDPKVIAAYLGDMDD
ncbi:MAG: ABC transporter ATP-binding protein [bacterium]